MLRIWDAVTEGEKRPTGPIGASKDTRIQVTHQTMAIGRRIAPGRQTGTAAEGAGKRLGAPSEVIIAVKRKRSATRRMALANAFEILTATLPSRSGRRPVRGLGGVGTGLPRRTGGSRVQAGTRVG